MAVCLSLAIAPCRQIYLPGKPIGNAEEYSRCYVRLIQLISEIHYSLLWGLFWLLPTPLNKVT